MSSIFSGAANHPVAKDTVQQAMQILMVFKHCRESATQLQKCQKEAEASKGHWFGGITGDSACQQQQVKRITCKSPDTNRSERAYRSPYTD